TIKGRNLATGLPNSIEVEAQEITKALEDPLGSIIEAIRSTLEKAPPEIAADIIETGMMLAGGGALLKNIDILIGKTTNMPVHIAEEPLNCVAKGTGKALDKINLLKRIAISY
ncbi:MAG: rod shape-determining protein, partial [Peptococcales bacterium]